MGGAREVEQTVDLEQQQALASVLRKVGGPAEPVRVGRYEITGRLGHGAFGDVYAAHDPQLQRDVAIKVVARSRRKGRAEARLVREGQALAKLQHPNVVPVYDVGIGDVDDGSRRRGFKGIYIVMERIVGRTLAQWQRDAAPGPDEILAAYRQAAEGLAAAHAVGVVHRDFKPANAMVTDDGTIIVLDFGLAAAHDALGSGSPSSSPSADESRDDTRSDSLTETGTVMGTPRYMAPEQHHAEAVGPAADQYAWCIALWEALTGTPPYEATGLTELAEAKRSHELPSATAIPAVLRPVLARGLDPDPARRFDSMASLLAALEKAPGRRRRRRVGLAMAGVGLAGAAWLLRPVPVPELCDEPDDAPPWSAARVDAVAGQLLTSPAPVAPQTADQARARQLRFGDAWTEARDELCASIDTSPRDRPAAEAACLVRARDAYRAALGRLEAAPVEGEPRLLDLWGLRSPARCRGDAVDTAFTRTPQALAAHDDVRAEIERVIFEVPIPPPADLPDTVQRALAVAEEIDEPALATAARLATARAAMLADRNPLRAADLMIEAAWSAQAEGDDLFAIELLLESTSYLIFDRSDPAEVARLLRTARDIAEATGQLAQIGPALDNVAARSLHARGELEAALAAHRRIAEGVAAHPDPRTSHYLPESLAAIGDIHAERGDPWAAQVAYRQAVASVAAGDADDMRAYVDDIYERLARASIEIGDFATASTAALHSMRSFGDPRTSPGRALRRLALYGNAIALGGATDQGLALIRSTIDQLHAIDDDATHVPTHDLARLLQWSGRAIDAIPLVDRIRIRTADEPTTTDEARARDWAWLAVLHARAGDPTAAREALAHAELLVADVAATDPPRSEALAGGVVRLAAARAEVALAEGDIAAASREAAIALADPTLHTGTPLARGDLGDVYAVGARAYAGLGDETSAAAWRTLAAEAYAGAEPLRRDRAAARSARHGKGPTASRPGLE